MNEQEMYLQSWEQEFQTTMKVLRAYPENRQDFKPHEISRSAKELAWTFVIEEKLLDQTFNNEAFQTPFPPPPASLSEVLSIYEQSHRENLNRIKNLSEQDYNKTVKFISGPNKMSDFRFADICWFNLNDMIHHRGQFSVYLRMAGGKVPSIYGPTFDEPWM